MDGDHRIAFNKDWKWAKYLDGETQVNLPCRKCIGCNMAKQREWSVRCFHEALLHTRIHRDEVSQVTTKIPNSCVLTLTYNDEHLPENGLLRHADFQAFMKRLRKHCSLRNQPSPRYFMCGEYGGKTFRPHYHAIIFGWTPERLYEERDQSGKITKMAYDLDALWSYTNPSTWTPTPMGRASWDAFSFAGAGYVAGYVAKKQVEKHLGPVLESTDSNGVYRCEPLAPEYRRMSLKPGLGAKWILQPQNLERVYSTDEVKIGEWTFHPPKYYDNLIRERRPDLWHTISSNRRDGMSKAAEDWTPERCAAAEQVVLSDLQSRRDSL